MNSLPRWFRDQPQNTIVIAKNPMRFCERITSENLKAIYMGQRPGCNRAAFTSIDDLAGATDETAAFSFYPRWERAKPYLDHKNHKSGQRPSCPPRFPGDEGRIHRRPTNVLGVAGFVLPSDRVDVI